MANSELAKTLLQVFESSNASDSSTEPVNMVDVIDGLGRQIMHAAKWLGNGDAITNMGALEAHGKAILDGCAAVASAITDLADAVRDLKRGGE